MDKYEDENLPSMHESNLPVTLPNEKYPDVDEVKKPSLTEEAVINFDASLDHYGFKMLGWAWGQVRTINDVAKLLHMQHEHQIHHRNHRLMPNAHQASTGRVFTVTPLD